MRKQFNGIYIFNYAISIIESYCESIIPAEKVFLSHTPYRTKLLEENSLELTNRQKFLQTILALNIYNKLPLVLVHPIFI